MGLLWACHSDIEGEVVAEEASAYVHYCYYGRLLYVAVEICYFYLVLE